MTYKEAVISAVSEMVTKYGSLGKVSKSTGVDRAILSKMINGKYTPKIATMKKWFPEIDLPEFTYVDNKICKVYEIIINYTNDGSYENFFDNSFSGGLYSSRKSAEKAIANYDLFKLADHIPRFIRPNTFIDVGPYYGIRTVVNTDGDLMSSFEFTFNIVEREVLD